MSRAHGEVHEGLLMATGRAAVVGGGVGLASLVTVLVGEVVQGEAFMGSASAQVAGWLSFLGACLLVVGLAGAGLRHAASLSGPGRTAWLLLVFAATVTAGASSTMALVLPALAEHAPELISDPPAAVPATFILSGVVMGVSGIVLAVSLRRTALVPRWTTTLLLIASVVSIVPLPSRYFAVALAVGVLVLARAGASSPERTAVPAGV